MAQPHNKKLGEYPMTTRGREQGPEKRYRRLRFPAFTAAKWTTANPLLQRGELGVETDTRKIKVGDGITYWNDLEYAKASGDWGDITGDITEQTDLVDFVNAAVAAEASIRAQADQQLQANIDNVAVDLTEHEQDTSNPHNVTKAQVGLGNVDNTSDADKPVSTAQATAINNAVSTHNVSETAHSNQFSQYRTSASQDTIDNQIKSDITNLQSTKADKATTLAGYGITDAYTKTEVDAKVSSVYRFRGSVATYANLPTTGQVVGDVWNVEDTGANYAWSGTEWDKLSETVDLTPYLTKTEASSTYATQSALAEVSTVAETAQQTANAAGTTAAQALAGLDSKQDKLGFATATTAGIVRVGSGSQMVVNASTGDISLDGTKAASIRTTIDAPGLNVENTFSGTFQTFKLTNLNFGTAVETAQYAGINFYDASGTRLGGVELSQQTTNTKRMSVGLVGSTIRFDITSGGIASQALSANPPSDSSSTQIATTQWVRGIITEQMGGDFVQYWDSADSADHSHAKPGVSTPTDHGWYRYYKSGWVEQGGVTENLNNTCIQVTLPIAMTNNSFTAVASGNTSGIAANYNGVTCDRRSSTQIVICTTGQQGNGCSWHVEGYAA